MKLLILSDDFPPNNIGGAGVVARNIAKEFRSKGNDVYVITATQNKDQAGFFIQEDLKIHRIFSSYHRRWRAYLSLYNFQTIKTIRNLIREIKPDVVNAHNIHYHLSYAALKIAKKSGAAVFLTAHDAMLINYGKIKIPKDVNCEDYSRFGKISFFKQLKENRKRFNPFRNIVIKYYLRYVDKIITVSRSLARLLSINGIDNTVAIHNGIRIREWEMPMDLIKDFREKYGVKHKRVIVFSGRLNRSKGGFKIIEILSQVIKVVPDAVLMVIGQEDGHTKSMRSFASQKGVIDNMIFTGLMHPDDIKIAYFSSYMAVMPSIYFEAFGLVNIEAMAAKKAVVATCFGGVPEIIVDGETGYIVNPNNIDKFAQRIVELLTDCEKSVKFGERGYQRVVSYFDLNQQYAKYDNLFRNIIND